jgi:uncharacterized cupredoxin-like copper-binding protein
MINGRISVPGWPEPRSPWRLSAVMALLVAVAAGCGGGGAVGSPTASTPVSTSPASTPASTGDPAAEVRAIEVSTTDTLRFEPSAITVKAGETVRFVVTNPGAVEHEFYVGDEAAQQAHAEEMAGGEMDHGDANGIEIPPGETNELDMTFDTPGELLIGCHVPGHYEAGMKATLTVEG